PVCPHLGSYWSDNTLRREWFSCIWMFLCEKSTGKCGVSALMRKNAEDPASPLLHGFSLGLVGWGVSIPAFLARSFWSSPRWFSVRSALSAFASSASRFLIWSFRSWILPAYSFWMVTAFCF